MLLIIKRNRIKPFYFRICLNVSLKMWDAEWSALLIHVCGFVKRDAQKEHSHSSDCFPSIPICVQVCERVVYSTNSSAYKKSPWCSLFTCLSPLSNPLQNHTALLNSLKQLSIKLKPTPFSPCSRCQ